jgi:tetratricopeptide (TPR) repeat protein
MKQKASGVFMVVLGLVLCLCVCAEAGEGGPVHKDTAAKAKPAAHYAGSMSCRECHERFYGLWSTSFHGLAMQPYTETLARERLAHQKDDVVIGKNRYRAEIGSGAGYVLEVGPDGKKSKYRIEYALGGKNVFYFLTSMERGRLQTLPVAYDVRKKEWFDTALSGLRHFPGQQGGEAPVGWQEWPYTFNTSCYGCHVSQLSNNYDLKTDSYTTTWKEPGINCESCHGPSEAHNEAMRKFPKGEKLPDTTDFRIIRTKKFTPANHNDACNSCHSKAMPLTAGYKTPEPFFDHFDLVTLENPDFYPDGRDLGENYTQTSWLMSPCVKGGKLHCITCHTSSGRYRFKKENFNSACIPCHGERVKNVAAHSHHPAESEASRCISCHMPKTEFARMQRTDHSMLPPTPATTIAYHSPNACNGCHADKDAAWADKHVRSWRQRDYQAPVLKRAGLIDAARKRDWTKLPEMLTYINDSKSDEIFVTSLIRLLAHCDDPAKVLALRKAINDSSPLVRGAAVEGLGQSPSLEVLQDIAAATGDDYRLVRVRAAAALAQFPNMKPQGKAKERVDKATEEYLAALLARPDSWDAHYNLGNYYLGQNRPKEALAEYDIALEKEPQALQALVNAAMAHAKLGKTARAEEKLNEALKISPDSAAALFNLGLVKAEQGDLPAAENNLRASFKADPQLAGAAYNLCIITATDRPAEALEWCRKADTLRPGEPKYAWTLAFYQQQSGDAVSAVITLDALIKRVPAYADAYLLLADIHEKQGKKDEAVKVYNLALTEEGISPKVKGYIKSRLEVVQKSDKAGRFNPK